MSAPAKSIRPRAERALARRRLFKRLDAARRGAQAIWISGPPGAGKTTLLSTWIDARRVRAVWLRLDERDADPATLFRELQAAAALRSRRAARLAVVAPSPADDLASATRHYFRSLFAALPSGTVVVLDDLDAAGLGGPLAAVLRAAIEEVPAERFLVLAARAPPPSALARLRLHGALASLGEPELRATLSETAALQRLRRVPGGRRRAEAIQREARGWMAGVAVALAHREVPGAARGRHAFEYMAGEVFDRVAPDAQRLLLEVALLDDPTDELVERATGHAGARTLLSSLARSGLFVLLHEDGERRFELHALFRDFLLARGSHELPPGRAAEVRRAAAAALAPRGPRQAEEALVLLAAAGAETDFDALLAREAARLVGEGRLRELGAWLARIPRARIEADPWLTLWDATARTASDPRAANAAALRALDRFEGDGVAAGAWLAWAAAAEAVLNDWSDFSPLPGLLERFEGLQARHPVPSEEVGVRATLVALALFVHHSPAHSLAEQVAESARTLALSPAPAPLRLLAGSYWMHYAVWWRGDFERARPVVEALGELARGDGIDASAAILWNVMEAPYHAGRGDEASAARCAEAGRALARRTGIHVWDLVLEVQGLWAAYRTGDLESARRHVAAMRGYVRPGKATDLAFLRVNEACLALRSGDAMGALALASAARDLADRSHYPIPGVMAELVLVRATSLQGDGEGAEAALVRAGARILALRSPSHEQMLALLEADHRLRSAGAAEAAAPLARALALGAAGVPHVRYLLAPAELAALLGAAIDGGVEPSAALGLARTLALPAPPEAGAEWPRELRVRVLGPFSAERAGRELAGGRAHRRPLELLRALVSLGGRDVPDATLAEALWPDAEGDAALHSLETTLYRLRRAVGPAAVIQRGGRLSMDRARCWVDAFELEERLARLARAVPGKPASAAELTRVAALLRGPLLAGDADAAWAADARARLRLRLARALDAAAASGCTAADLAPLLERAADVGLGAPPPRLRLGPAA